MTSTSIDHHDKPQVKEAAPRLADQPPGSVLPAVQVIKELFGLTAVETCEAASQAEKLARRTGAV